MCAELGLIRGLVRRTHLAVLVGWFVWGDGLFRVRKTVRPFEPKAWIFLHSCFHAVCWHWSLITDLLIVFEAGTEGIWALAEACGVRRRCGLPVIFTPPSQAVEPDRSANSMFIDLMYPVMQSSC